MMDDMAEIEALADISIRLGAAFDRLGASSNSKDPPAQDRETATRHTRERQKGDRS